ncbi:tyrosine-type recombinase/integrase [Niallia nealsonii]|uniref:tyrosine-type recombinase/integrase n=1 Tax=Niallia nealsonii TaxID=115979 RepID=UPI00269743D7|nr:tyrosine-type recombinase/integrase [Niallia nealsonii]
MFIKYLGDIPIEDITTESIKLYLGEVASELKASSLCHRIRFIKSLFKWTQEEEIEILREACLSPFEKALFEFMYSTGCRIGKIGNLDQSSINFSEQSIIVEKRKEKFILIHDVVYGLKGI